MTAEVVVMNTSAVAMAADSAVTVGNHIQSYNTSNKLFGLSPDHSVGVMIYGTVFLNSVPWETLIKSYRGRLDKEGFSSLKEYADYFIEFLRDDPKNLFPPESRNYDLDTLCKSIARNFLKILFTEWVSNATICCSFGDFIDDYNSKLPEIDLSVFGKIPDNFQEELYQLVFRVVDESNFPKIKSYDILHKYIFAMLFEKIKERTAGIVFSGFGNDEFFPSTYSFEVYGGYFGEIRIGGIEDNCRKVGYHQVESMILPYAQEAMTNVFIRGVNLNQFEKVITKTFDKTTTGMIDYIISGIEDLNTTQKQKWREHYQDANKALKPKIKKVFKNQLINESKEMIDTNKKKIENALIPLSKGDLAKVANDIIQISVLQKQLTPGDDSVGEPIDVAVISKADGLIWVKRKHYFDKHLNPHYFTKF